MCLIAFAWKHHEKYPLIVLANRDEFYRRPTQPASYWEDHPHVLAGRDLEAGGTWMGVSKMGRWAALTNYRDPGSLMADAPSRGELTTNFLTAQDTPLDYLKAVQAADKKYNGYNLLVGDLDQLYCYNNVNHNILKVSPGVHALSNALLDTPWPKAAKAKGKLQAAIASESLEPRHLLELMLDRRLADDTDLPSTGIPLHWERALSAMFISSEEYGTSITTVLRVSYSGKADFLEYSHPINGRPAVKKLYQLTF